MSILPVAMAKFDIKQWIGKVKQWKLWLPKVGMSLAAIAVCAALIGFSVSVGPEVLHVVKSHLAKGPAGSVIHAIESVQNKVKVLAESHAENDVLKKENQYLRLELGLKNYDIRSLASEAKTNSIGLELEKETGLKTGRVVETLKYKIPPNLLPQNLYLLGLTYLRDGKSEAAAAIFHFLMNGSDGKTYQTPTNFILSAISWFQVDHLELAESYFSAVLKLSPDSNEEILRLHAVARVWMAAIEKKRGHSAKANRWLHEVLDFHPKSLEARWVNGLENPGRSLAGESLKSDTKPNVQSEHAAPEHVAGEHGTTEHAEIEHAAPEHKDPKPDEESHGHH